MWTIPLMKQLGSCVTSLYDLMDSAYDVPAIRQVSVSLGHVPLIDHNKRRGEKIAFAPAEAVRSAARCRTTGLSDSLLPGPVAEEDLSYMRRLAIDFGTSNTVAALAVDGQAPRTVNLRDSHL